MDYIFIPVVVDHEVMHSSLTFATAIKNYARLNPKVHLKEIFCFWNKFVKREKQNIFQLYSKAIERLEIKMLQTKVSHSTIFKREIETDTNQVFRSTLFPPDNKLLRHTDFKDLIEEICQVMGLNSHE